MDIILGPWQCRATELTVGARLSLCLLHPPGAERLSYKRGEDYCQVWPVTAIILVKVCPQHRTKTAQQRKSEDGGGRVQDPWGYMGPGPDLCLLAMGHISLLVSPASQTMDKVTVPSVTLIVGCGVSSLTLLMLVIIYVSVWR